MLALGAICHAPPGASTPYPHLRRALPVIALTEAAHMICVANDYGFDEVFARGVEAFGNPEDFLPVISTSGGCFHIRSRSGRRKTRYS